MIWLPNKKYASDHFSKRLAETYTRVRRETRRMAYVASTAVAVMALTQMTYIFAL